MAARSRRQALKWIAGASAIMLAPQAMQFASAAEDFFKGPPVKDIPAKQISKHVWLIYSPDGFPTPENRGMMANVTFVVTSKGVVILDTGASLQIGEMAIRMIKKVTDKPVIAIFNSHYHGDHINGLLGPDGAPAFPNAEVLAPALEHKFWTDEGELSRTKN
ncbi:MAG: MBL fold metallo-hydrolase, partial [Burkholderiaceae bacterium]|nr:MBL fold metallo-hydrolase [Burkholderiaceae bacterium]